MLALTAIAWAAGDLLGSANEQSANAGKSSSVSAFATMDTIKPQQKPAPNVDWALEKQLRNELKDLEHAYLPVADQAKAETVADGKVSDSTRTQLLDIAHAYKDTSDKYADNWAKGNCITRANTAREAGNTLLASAELMVSEVSSEKSDALKTQQARMNDARGAYAKEAHDNNELSAADKADIKANVVPGAEMLVSNATDMVAQVFGLLDEVRTSASPAGLVGGVGGCASKSATSGGAGAGTAGLLGPVSSLYSLAEDLLSNAKSLLSDATLLSS